MDGDCSYRSRNPEERPEESACGSALQDARLPIKPRRKAVSPRSLVNEIKTLFSLPEVVSKLGGLLNSPTTTNAELGEVLIHDPALTARVLQLANAVRPPSSPPVDTVSGAVALIGRESLRNLILATSVTSRFHGIPPELADMERFWLNSVACGAIARSLAFRCRVFDSEPLFVAGLLHKVGRLVFLSRRPEQYREVLEMGGGSEEALNQAEQVVFGFTHAELGRNYCAIGACRSACRLRWLTISPRPGLPGSARAPP